MKNIIYVGILAVSLFARSVQAGSSFICRSQNQLALLKIGDPRVEEGSYDECNGGAGDEMTNCQPHPYSVVVQDMFLKIRVKEGYLNGQTMLLRYGSMLQGSMIVVYREHALHLDVGMSHINPVPIIHMKVMAQGRIPGQPIEIANDVIPCKTLR
ncbi:MAG: hypothetical protein KF865_04570 [Bdellovibrionaceae bacterium]|nr:hypothetical protein [Pseudobdellovibrionaceae bacterium]